MKNFVKIIFLFILIELTSLPLTALEINHLQNIDRCVNYTSTISLYDNNLFISARGSLEIYEINHNNNLNLVNYYYEYIDPISIIYNDSLILAYSRASFTEQYHTNSKLLIYRIYHNRLEVSNQIFFPNIYDITKLSVNAQYYFVTNNAPNPVTYVIEKNSMQEVTTLSIGNLYEVKDNYLFINTTFNNQAQLTILDISNINEPQLISEVVLGDIQQNLSYKFHNNLLFITRNRDIIIVDISNINNPTVITHITDIPNLYNNNFIIDLLFYGNYIIFYNQSSKMWIYDISDITNPLLTEIINDFEESDYYSPHMIIKDNTLFCVTKKDKISKMDLENITNITKNIGSPSWQYLIYSANIQNSLFYTQIDNYGNAILKYYNSETSNHENIYTNYAIFPGSSIKNDSLFFFTSYQNNQRILNELKVTENNVSIINQTQIEDNYIYPILLGNNLIIKNYENDTNLIFPLTSDNLIDIDNYTLFSFDSETKLVNYSKYCDTDYLFFEYYSNNMKKIKVFENNSPFNLISELNLSTPKHNGFDYSYLLDNHHIVTTEKMDFLTLKKKLFYISPPDTVLLLDTMIDDYLYIGFVNNNLFYEKKVNMETDLFNVKFITIQNGSFEPIYNYEFNYEIFSLQFLQDSNKFYAVGRYYIQEYSYQLTGSEDDYITPISDIQLINYPNPFNPQTTISFSLDNIKKHTEIEIFNLKGQKIKNLKIDNPKIGKNTVIWNGKDNNNRQVASGIYLYSLKQDGKIIQTEKMIMLK